MDKSPKAVTIGVYTAYAAVNKELQENLTPMVKGYNIEFIPYSKDPMFVITLPEFIPLFDDKIPLIILSDDVELLKTYDNIVELSPFPLSKEDYERIAWRMIASMQEALYGF